MTAREDEYAAALDAAVGTPALAGIDARPAVPPRRRRPVAEALGELPDGPTDAAEVVDLLGGPSRRPDGDGVRAVLRLGHRRHPARRARRRLAGQRLGPEHRHAQRHPGVVAAEETAARWLLDLLGLPAGADVGFVTGATMANFSCLAAAREQVLADAGWDVDQRGLNGAPPVAVLVGASGTRPSTWRCATSGWRADCGRRPTTRAGSASMR